MTTANSVNEYYAQERSLQNGDNNNNNNKNNNSKDGQIALTFSIWGPPNITNSTLEVEETVMDALQTFLCEDTGLVVLDDYYKSICPRRGGGNNNHDGDSINNNGNGNADNFTLASILEFIASTNKESSFVKSDGTISSTTDFEQDGIQWTTWKVYYEVLQIGTIYKEQAKMMNVTSEEMFMEDVTQLALDVSTMDGTMDTRMGGTGLKMSMVGMEVETFQDVVIMENSSSSDSEQYSLEIQESGWILRDIGIGLLALNLVTLFMLTYLGRKQRLEREEKKALLDQDSEKKTALVTEQDVNRMLDVGRKESFRLLSVASSRSNQE